MAYQFKVSLQDIEPIIWRRFLIPKTATLADFTFAIEDCMQWSGTRLHRFIIEKSIPLPDYDNGEWYDMLTEMSLESILKYEIEYEYNIKDELGEGWMHTIEFEGEVDQNIIHPLCIDGSRACPIEDIDDYPMGYYDFLKTMSDISDPYRERLCYVYDIDGFDPEKFDVSSIRYRKYVPSGAKRLYWN
jgi:hypothetical protein